MQDDTSSNVAEFLLQVKAIKLQPDNPFTWASGWKSPIYCDNRIALSHPRIRTYIRQEFVKAIEKYYGRPDMIAAVATGAIAQGALVAEAMGLPLVYVRPTPKEHGTKNQIEGEAKPNHSCVVIEDLVSTGKSSLSAVDALRKHNVVVKGMVCAFNYGFDVAAENFKKAGVPLYSLSNYESLLKKAVASKYITENQVETLQQWRENPAEWKKK
ncbi:MAG TPA: orotate phosphoribosyltransferase [Bacteroidia bacterium]|nr:orotate phosphoribosyltransferase [Bacteroidia bacterium]HNU34469.1 orotate phosphoribosyltransferase [Bacteroidia bacterium]